MAQNEKDDQQQVQVKKKVISAAIFHQRSSRGHSAIGDSGDEGFQQ